MVTLLHIVALALYLAAAALLLRSLLRGSGAQPPRIGTYLLVPALAVHLAGLVVYTEVFQELPLVGLGPSLSTFVFLLGGLIVPLATAHAEARPLALLLSPLAAVLLAAALAIGLAPAGPPVAFRGAWFATHVLLALLAYASLALACAAGVCYLIQFHELKSKHLGRWFRFLPSLETLDRVGRRALAVGFPLLTVAILLGWAWAVRFEYALWTERTKLLWAATTWVIFLLAIAARLGGAERARRGALASIVAFPAVVADYIVLRLTAGGSGFF